MSVRVIRKEGLVIVRFEERKLTNDEQILRIHDDLSKVLESISPGTRLLLDFQNVDQVASMMLGDLVALNKRAARTGVDLHLCGLSTDVLRVIRTCKLDSLFDILEELPGELS